MILHQVLAVVHQILVLRLETGVVHDGENFQQFMECLFGEGASEEDISNALDGSSGSPTEQEIRDCFTPLYNTGSVAGSTTATTPGSGSTDETEDAGGDEDEDEGEDSTSGATSEDEDESEE